jgi:pSer/pThr/pTyr-binding forkhead associated (FHA) protein
MDQVEMNRPRKVSAIEPEDAPHLVVVSAELQGQEFACIRSEIRIGRTDDNDIAIDHRSLSRTHAKLVREDSGEWRIIDLQSANGMAVNGESYAQSSLAHGDLIELGHVKLRFVGPGQSSDGLLNEKTASRGSKKTLLFALAGTVLLLVGAVAAWLVVGQRPADPGTPRQPAVVEKPAEQPRQATPPEPATGTATQPSQTDAAQLAEKLRSARAAMDTRDFDKAVSELQPVADSNTEATELLQQAQAEQQAKQNLELAQKAFDETRNQDAQKYLEASEGTLAFDAEHAALKAKVEAALAPPTRPGTKSGTARRSPAEQARQLYDDGVTLVRKQQLPEAESVLKKCINLDPTYAPCYLALGAAVARRNRPAEGAQYYREFLRLAPNHEMAPSVRRLVADYDKSQKQPGGGK